MKVVKLNRRFKQFKEHGHTIAFRFDGWNSKATAVERVCRARLQGGGWFPHQDWYSYYGKRLNCNEVRPYWITFRNETDATLVLLCADLTK
jgi:hypothetical protein